MDFISKIVSGVVGLTVGGVLVANVLLTTLGNIQLTGENADTYETMLGVVGLMAIVSLVVFAANMIRSRQ